MNVIFVLHTVPGPYPPPPGAHNVSPVRKWPWGEVGSAVEARRKRVPSNEGKKYHNDPLCSLECSSRGVYGNGGVLRRIANLYDLIFIVTKVIIISFWLHSLWYYFFTGYPKVTKF